MKRAEDAFKKHMDKATKAFEQKVLPKLKKAVTSKATKGKSKGRKLKKANNYRGKSE